MMRRPIVTLAAGLLVVACGKRVPRPLPVDVGVAEEAWVEEISAGRELVLEAISQRPAISVAVRVADKLVWSEARGWANLEPNVAVTTGTRFRGYSVAKALTGTLALRLADAGRVELDAPISTYLQDLPVATGRVTLRQLLGHLGGIRHYRDGEWMSLARDHCEAARDAVAGFVNDPLETRPGSTFSYSTFGFVLASAVLEAATGQRFPDLVAEAVFAPAGMRHTSFDSPDRYDATTATGYEWSRGARPLPDIDNSCKFGAGSLLTTSEDLAAFGTALLDGRLVGRDSLPVLFRSQTTASGEATGYSLGWGVSDDGQRISHSGGSPGGRAFLLVDREHDVVVALGSNVEGERLTETAERLCRLFATGTPR